MLDTLNEIAIDDSNDDQVDRHENLTLKRGYNLI